MNDVISPEVLLNAYCEGFFPMADSVNGDINWYQPKKRSVFILKDLKLPRSVNQIKNKNIFKITFDKSFEKIIRSCAKRDETWISEKIIKTYCEMFELGFGHSVEAWKNGVIAGGLYGISIGGAFFGESMFSNFSGASKIALASLIKKLKSQDYDFIDAQYMTTHLKMLGAIEISNAEYLNILKITIKKDCKFYDKNNNTN
ncbi:MAG: leucyl/phenylalanyl-tRNA--protein transferase [Bacteroidota bacterium]